MWFLLRSLAEQSELQVCSVKRPSEGQGGWVGTCPLRSLACAWEGPLSGLLHGVVADQSNCVCLECCFDDLEGLGFVEVLHGSACPPGAQC